MVWGGMRHHGPISLMPGTCARELSYKENSWEKPCALCTLCYMFVKEQWCSYIIVWYWNGMIFKVQWLPFHWRSICRTVLPAGQKLLAFSLEERMKDCEEARRVDHLTGKADEVTVKKATQMLRQYLFLRVVIVFPLLCLVSCGLSGNPEVC